MFLTKRSAGKTRMAVYGVIVVLVVLAMIRFADVTRRNAAGEGLRIARDSAVRAAVQCYALEGSYPPSLDYLKNHYGLSPNEDLYIIHYQYVAGNLMPDITVLQRTGDSVADFIF